MSESVINMNIENTIYILTNFKPRPFLNGPAVKLARPF